MLSTEDSIKDLSAPKHLEKVKGLVEFKDVSFHYDGAQTDVLEHISFTAKPADHSLYRFDRFGQIHPRQLDSAFL